MTETVENIVDIVVASDDFNILAMAVGTAGLGGALSAEDADLTVFAPTDEAFKKLAQDLGLDFDPDDDASIFAAIAGALTTLGGGDPIPLLTDILTYHVSPGAKGLAEVAALQDVPTLLEGATFSPVGTSLFDNEPDLKDPELAVTDVPASNGIIHVIDRVLIPLDIPGNDRETITIEAEDMVLDGYEVKKDKDASEDKLIKLDEHTGSASGMFTGVAGEYALNVHYFDEIDGEATIDVKVNGETVYTIMLNQELGGKVATSENLTSMVIDGVHLEYGDEISFVGHRDENEFARLDKVEIIPVDPKPTIAEIATEAGSFEILLMALEAADLVSPFTNRNSDLTVFAPTDEAFYKLAVDFGYEGDAGDKGAIFAAIAGALSDLGGGDPIPLLTDVLLYHVSPGSLMLADVAALEDVPTLLEGATFSPDGTTLVDNEPHLADPSLAATDIMAANGVVHIIDRVLIPLDIPGNEPNIVEAVAGSDDFNILAMAVGAAGLGEALAAEGADLTVFAPTDDAFIKLAHDLGLEFDPTDDASVFAAIAGALTELGGGDPIPLLTDILLYHVSPGAKMLADVAALDDVPTLLEGATFSPDGTSLIDNEPDLKDPSLAATDLELSNGIVHVIDRVLLPIDIPGNEPVQIMVEAEDMDLSGYKVRKDKDASEDKLIKLKDDMGTASTAFMGQAGKYDLEVFYFDEIDGESTIDVMVNGEHIDTIHLDQLLGGVVATDENRTSHVIEGLDLEYGDVVELVGHRDDYEFARIDKISFNPVIPKPTIAEIATEAGSFEILLMALEAADLVDPFADKDSDLTVFAPTDEAFYKLAVDFGYEGDAGDKGAIFAAIAGALSDLGGGDPIPLLTDVLLYHVSPGSNMLADVAMMEDVPTLLEGATFSPDGTSLVDNEPHLEDPSLVATDIMAENGIVHVIDRVLIPLDIPGNTPNIVELVAGSDDFNILAMAVGAAGLGGALSAEDADLTVFAPTDDAFIKLAKDLGLEFDESDDASVFGAIAGALTELGGGDPIPLLTDILLYHVSPGAKMLGEVAALEDVPTLLEGATFSPDGTSLVDNEPDLKDPSLAVTDVEVSNGIVHVIDRVLVPADLPVEAQGPITIEAEDMDLSGYSVRYNEDASEYDLIKLKKMTGEASTAFDGVGGAYDLEVFYFDEIDGQAQIDILVNGAVVDTIDLDQELGGIYPTAENATSYVVEDLHLERGDTITLVGHRDDNEFARIDKISITSSMDDDMMASESMSDDMMI